MGKRLLLAVIIADSHIEFQSEILRGVISQSFRANCDTTIIAPMHNFSFDSIHKNAEKQLFDLLFSSRIDGIIYARNSFATEAIRVHIDDICKQSGKPVMLLDSDEHKNFETTSVDDCEAFEIITDHLIDVHGHKKISHRPEKYLQRRTKTSGLSSFHEKAWHHRTEKLVGIRRFLAGGGF